MTFPDEQTQQAWSALTQQKHARLAKALEIARRSAWLDLPRNEQVRYLEWAYAALKQEEETNPKCRM